MTYAATLGGWAGKTALGDNRAIALASPAANDSVTMFWTNTAITVSSLLAVVSGTTPSVTFSVYSGTDRSGTGNTVILNSNVCTNTTGGFIPGTLGSTAIAANSFVWVYINAVSGTVSEFSLTMRL